MIKKSKQIHNSGFLISPTANLFPLSGQSGNRGVSIMITSKCNVETKIKYCEPILLNTNRTSFSTFLSIQHFLHYSSSFLINPTTNLFPLSGQSGNRGVSITITLKCEIWSMELITRSSILPCKSDQF